jgi:hypothetical protein
LMEIFFRSIASFTRRSASARAASFDMSSLSAFVPCLAD